MPLRRAFSSASTTASGDDLDAPDLAGPAGQRQAEGADPAEEVEDALGAGQPGHLRGDRVEALGHLRVGLEEGAVGDPEAQAAELLLEVLGAQRTGGAVGAAAGPFDDRVQVDGRPGNLGRRGDEAALQLSRAATFPDHQVPQHALSAALVVGGQARGARPVAELVAACVVSLRGELAVLGVDDHVPATAGVEAEDELAVALAE